VALLVLAGVVNSVEAELTSADWLKKWLPELAERIDMHPVGDVIVQPYAHWPDGAPSTILFIEESSIQVHCYPEADFIEVVLHSCNDFPSWQKVAQGIVDDLDLDVRYFRHDDALNWRRRTLGAAPDYPTWPPFLRDSVTRHRIPRRQ